MRLKRILEMILVGGTALLWLPVCMVVGLCVRFKIGKPVFFLQARPGLHGRVFKIYKFRTMTEARDKLGNLLPDDQRLTSFGRFLRSTSLDELPELFNVLKGEMSLVGPRPLLMKYLPFYTEREELRHSVRPGITGWAQVNGRNCLSWNERLKLDVWYVENQSFLLDIRILVSTITSVLTRKGLVVDPSSAMLDFDEERRSWKGEK